MVELRIRTSQFPTGPEGDLIGNNGKPGSHLAQFLRSAFINERVKIKDILQEDYGWGFWLEDEHSQYWVAVGIQEEDKPNKIPIWLILVDQSKELNPLKWFRKAPNREPEIMDRIQTKIKEINDVKIEAE